MRFQTSVGPDFSNPGCTELTTLFADSQGGEFRVGSHLSGPLRSILIAGQCGCTFRKSRSLTSADSEVNGQESAMQRLHDSEPR